MKIAAVVTMDTVPDELLAAFCAVPAAAVAMSVTCRRFYEHFRAAGPVFTCRQVGECKFLISSGWYIYRLSLPSSSSFGGPLDDNPVNGNNTYTYIYDNLPLYVLGDIYFEGNVYYSNVLPWFYPLKLDTGDPPLTLRWFRRVKVFEQKQNSCCYGIESIGHPINAFIAHSGASLTLLPVNEQAFDESGTAHARALYRIVAAPGHFCDV